MEDILSHLCETSGINGSLLVGKDGIVIASHIRSGEDPDLLGAIIADLFGGIGSAFERFSSGNIDLISIEKSDGKLFLQHLEEANALLAVLAGSKVNMGLVRMEMKEASHKFKELLI